MADDQIDEHDDSDRGHSAAVDPFLVALQLCSIATNAKAVAPAIKRLRKLGRDIERAERQFAAVQDRAAQTNAALDQRQAVIEERERAIAQREDEFQTSLKEARDNLAEYYNNLADMDRRIRHRIMASAGLLAGFNERLQDLPSWDQLRRLVVGLPADPPPLERDVAHPRIDALSDTFSDPHADRHGGPFLGTLTRDASHRGAA
jgi:hypothetical protein